MTTAGDGQLGTACLMGDHAITKQMYRCDPAVMLYAPLRTVIYIGAHDRTMFAVDQPSTVFASLAGPAITQVGTELDHKLAGLLNALDVRAGHVLNSALTR